MPITSVWINEDTCTACGLCEEACPDVFEVGNIATVKEGANLAENEDCIREATEGCPVEAISFQES